ncbi:unnamed protein product [Soboliphyme baturini]|uniref:EB domain-containing protein n=1 Tax=Soboliphyme baturini TaxID=241478 RepID=A0A183IU31_9BILA|nr:unnamed protein product [Soboliphyme baturini]
MKTSPTMMPTSPGSSCRNNEQCLGGSACDSGTNVCMCPRGTVDHSGQCEIFVVGSIEVDDSCIEVSNAQVSIVIAVEIPVTVGQSCRERNDCEKGAYCNMKSLRCQCFSRDVEIDKKCFRIMYPGQKGCHYNRQCAASYEGAICANATCICSSDNIACKEHEILDKYRGVISASLLAVPGSTCSDNLPCSGGAICQNGFCICPHPRMKIIDGTCLFPDHSAISMKLASNFYVPQYYTIQTTTQNSVPPLFAGPGSACGNYTVCLGNSTCIHNVCQCANGTVSSDWRCVPAKLSESNQNALPYESCSHGETCTGNSFCDGTICRCPANTILTVEKTCQSVRFSVPYSSCAEGQQCLGGSYCNPNNWLCECPDNQQPVNDQCVNLPTRVTVNYGPQAQSNLCSYDSECTGGAICIDGVCTCPDGMTMNEQSICSVNSNPINYASGQCHDDAQCYHGFVCMQNMCQCPPYKVLNSQGMCVANAQFQRTLSDMTSTTTFCQKDSQCSNGTICLENVCQCPPGQLQNSDNSCGPTREMVSIGAACNVMTLCAGGAVCMDGSCQCPPDKIQVGQVCLQSNDNGKGAK